MSDESEKNLAKAIKQMCEMVGVEQAHKCHTKEGRVKTIKFAVKSIIGRGTFGLVSMIESAGETKALKTVYVNRKYFNRELDILLDIQHPNVLNLTEYYFTRAQGQERYLHIAMEYLPVVMCDFLEKKDHPNSDIKHLLKQALRGLAYLHGLNICHRDIKPSNILLDEHLNLKICDFGSAKYMAENSPNLSYIGSRYYRAPENLMGSAIYSTKIDIWAMGLVFCEFRTKEPVFMAENASDVLDMIFKICCVDESVLIKYGHSGQAQGVESFLSENFDDAQIKEAIGMCMAFDEHVRASAEFILKKVFHKKHKQ
ncbi:glycogen synthase kinase 3 beta [Enteropsectra breve]|nr:glycogen synthase kinase 3 beta [Enteropsectra breve]